MTTDLPEPETPSDEDDEEEEGLPAVWHDSDDEQLTVSLADNQRLRKLRVAEAEDVISGKEYVRRLRKQYQQLNPEPAWARPELNKPEQDSSDEMDTEDEEEQSTQPLAKLLQNATDLTRVEDNQGGKRKLRQEVLDIQRLKDVGKTQPVCLLFFSSLLGEATNTGSHLSTHLRSTRITPSSYHQDQQPRSSCTISPHQP